jgi:hypothetical protein
MQRTFFRLEISAHSHHPTSSMLRNGPLRTTARTRDIHLHRVALAVAGHHHGIKHARGEIAVQKKKAHRMTASTHHSTAATRSSVIEKLRRRPSTMPNALCLKSGYMAKA